MASAIVREAFRAALETAYPGKVFDSLNAAPDFIPGADPALCYTVQFPGSTERRITLGGAPSCRRETGQAEVWVLAPSGKGDAEAVAAADAVRDLLRDAQLTPEIRATDCDPPIHFTPDDGGYFAAVVAVGYVYDFYR